MRESIVAILVLILMGIDIISTEVFAANVIELPPEQCNIGNNIGCMYFYGNADCSDVYGGHHDCHPKPASQYGRMCGCSDCQGPNGDRCQGQAPTTPPSPTPTKKPTPTPYTIPFMGIKIGQIKANQPLNLIISFFRFIFRLD